MKLAIVGTRGVPGRYGGFETMATELSRRLTARGHHVTVYCRSAMYEENERASWAGVERVFLPAIRGKYLETVSHTLLSALHASRQNFDAVLLCNAANAFVLPLLKLSRTPVAINVDGIERNRRKWNALGRTIYMLGEALSVRFADRVIADAEVIARYYADHYGMRTETIAYGAEFPAEEDSDVLARLGLMARDYVLYVSRFEPENNPDKVVEAYQAVRTTRPLVMLGDAPYSDDFIARLKSTADSRVIFPGALYGNDYRTLQRNAWLYVQATEVGGTHPALIEAMGSGGAVLANGTPENREVGGAAVRYFDAAAPHTLSLLLQQLTDDPTAVESMRGPARDRIREHYGWDRVTTQYEELFAAIRS